MMKPLLLERIRSFGHWRINIRPLGALSAPLSFEQAVKTVENARVSVRGWDFPHISHQNSDSSGLERGDKYVENWCDWDSQIEFWRMYRSGQFLSYKVLSYAVPNSLFHIEGRVLLITDAIFAITEFCEFAHRLHTSGLHAEGTVLFVDLNDTQGRQLGVGPGRLPFFDVKATQAPSVKLQRVVRPDEWEEGAAKVANGLILELFDHFGWNPPPERISAEQDKFHRRDFS